MHTPISGAIMDTMPTLGEPAQERVTQIIPMKETLQPLTYLKKADCLRSVILYVKPAIDI